MGFWPCPSKNKFEQIWLQTHNFPSLWLLFVARPTFANSRFCTALFLAFCTSVGGSMLVFLSESAKLSLKPNKLWVRGHVRTKTNLSKINFKPTIYWVWGSIGACFCVGMARNPEFMGFGARLARFGFRGPEPGPRKTQIFREKGRWAFSKRSVSLVFCDIRSSTPRREGFID